MIANCEDWTALTVSNSASTFYRVTHPGQICIVFWIDRRKLDSRLLSPNCKQGCATHPRRNLSRDAVHYPLHMLLQNSVALSLKVVGREKKPTCSHLSLSDLTEEFPLQSDEADRATECPTKRCFPWSIRYYFFFGIALTWMFWFGLLRIKLSCQNSLGTQNS